MIINFILTLPTLYNVTTQLIDHAIRTLQWKQRYKVPAVAVNARLQYENKSYPIGHKMPKDVAGVEKIVAQVLSIAVERIPMCPDCSHLYLGSLATSQSCFNCGAAQRDVNGHFRGMHHAMCN